MSDGQGEGEASLKWGTAVAAFPFNRVAETCSLIILLYGSLERFIEDLAEEYLAAVTSRTAKFNDLPDKIRKSHFELTIEQLKLTTGERYSGASTPADLTKSLHSCINNEDDFSFVSEPFMRHSANFRLSVIDEFFSRIAIPGICRRAASHNQAATYAASVGFVSLSGEHERLWSELDELVSLRNEIAHGDLTSSVSSTQLTSYCDLLENLGLCISRIARDQAAEFLYARMGAHLGAPIAIYGKSIVCLQSRGYRVAVGNLLACVNAQGFSHSLSINEIQSSGKSAVSVPPGADISIGVNTDGRCRMNYSIYLIV